MLVFKNTKWPTCVYILLILSPRVQDHMFIHLGLTPMGLGLVVYKLSKVSLQSFSRQIIVPCEAGQEVKGQLMFVQFLPDRSNPIPLSGFHLLLMGCQSMTGLQGIVRVTCLAQKHNSCHQTGLQCVEPLGWDVNEEQTNNRDF